MRLAIAFISTLFVLQAQPVVADTVNTLERIKESKTVRIGFRSRNPPMSFLDKENKPVGYSIDLCGYIVDEIKKELDIPDLATEYVAVTASNRFAALTDSSIDILCGATTKTLARSEVVDFTELTFVTGGSFLSMVPTGLIGIADLQGKKVAVAKDTTTISALTAALKQEAIDAEVVPVDSAAEGMAALVEGKVDAYSADQVVLIGLIIDHGDPEKFFISHELFSYEPFALAVGLDQGSFRRLANRVISRLYRSPQIGGLYEKWFGGFSNEVPSLVDAMFILTATPE